MPMTESSYVGFELPSTSGMHRLQFGLADAPGGLRLLPVYETSIYGQDSIEPEARAYSLPPIKVRYEEVKALEALCRDYANSMTSRQAQGEGAVFQVSHEHRLTLRFGPGGPGMVVPGWQALFSFELVAGPNLALSGGYIVDATCLDMFCESLRGFLDAG